MTLNILWQNEHYRDPIKGGGGAINTFYIVRAMDALGHEPVIIARGYARGGPIEETINGTKVIRIFPPVLPSKLWPIRCLLEPSRVRRLIAGIAETFDVFVCIDALTLLV